MNHIQQNVRDLMSEHHETSKHIAESVGMTESNFSRKLNGVRTWKIDELKKVADHFGVKIDALINERIGN